MIHGFFQMTGLVAAAHEAQTDIANWIWNRDGLQAPGHRIAGRGGELRR
jgi:hypothetical protein